MKKVLLSVIGMALVAGCSGGYTEAEARYLSHLEHEAMDERSADDLVKWGKITCEEAYEEGYTPRHAIRNEGGYTNGESILVSVAAIVELCPDAFENDPEAKFFDLEEFLEELKKSDSDTLDYFGR